jgi:secreted trypsin-like serine protease
MFSIKSARLIVVMGGAAFLLCCSKTADPISTHVVTNKVPPGAVQSDSRRSRMLLDIDIVQGEPVPAGRLMSVVGLTYGSESAPRCTGTLIAPDLVLTAAHCVCLPERDVRRVFVGTNWRASSGPEAGRYYPVSKTRSAIVRQPGQSCDDGLREGLDLALVKLSASVPGVSTLAPAHDSAITSARSFRIAGFGTTDVHATVQTQRKLHASVQAVSNNCQGSAVASRFGCQSGQEIVAVGQTAGGGPGPDTCVGDSGGPLLVDPAGTSGKVDGPFRIAGVTSRGVPSAATECGHGGVYERLTPAARGWINRTAVALRAR